MSLDVPKDVPKNVPNPKRWGDYEDDDSLPDISWVRGKLRTKSSSFYQTNILNTKMEVFSLSDIHGDIQSFVIALRDLAEVIKKKKEIPGYEFKQDEYDTNMEEILKLDLNTYEDKYIPDLNYEWCGGNTHVVICGDIIDPQRKRTCLKEDKSTPCAYYPQIELKLLMFINALNNQATDDGGKIVKLLGNHDLAAIIYPSIYKHYIYDKDLELENYYKNDKRIDIFKVGKPGFKLLVEGGIGILIKINNTIFVHGDLLQTYQYYDDLNQFINNPTYHEDTPQNHEIWQTQFKIEYESFTLYDINKILYNRGLYYQQQKKQLLPREELDKIMSQQDFDWYLKLLERESYLKNSSSLLSRMRGDEEFSSQRAISFESDNTQTELFCGNLITSFTQFASSNPDIIDENPSNLKLVIGHCTQHEISTIEGFTGKGYNVTYDKIIEEDSVKEVFGTNIFRGEVNFEDRGKIFGITMECQIPEQPSLSRIYRVDTGVSRDNDDHIVSDYRFPPHISSINSYIKTVKDENQYLYSRTPQILKINKTKQFFIIKSKMRNTRIHLPRPNYDEHVSKMPELQFTNPYYKQKYLKYKDKYLQLKQMIN